MTLQLQERLAGDIAELLDLDPVQVAPPGLEVFDDAVDEDTPTVQTLERPTRLPRFFATTNCIAHCALPRVQ